MTGRQIINGVNINECDNHYIENNKHICKYNFEECNPKKEQCTLYVTSIEEQLKAKYQECEEQKSDLADLSKIIDCKNGTILTFKEQLDQLKVENEKMSKGYAELTEIVSPYIDDFTGYNEKLGCFDIVLYVKELLQQFKHLKTENDETWKTMSITFYNGLVKTEVADMSMAEYSQIKLENTKYKQTLAEIKKIAKWHTTSADSEDVQEDMKQILQKINEFEVEDEM